MQDFLVDINKAQELGLLFRKSREMKNLTISSVSKKTKINIADLSRLETGQKLRINPFHIFKLCNLYRLPLVDIYLNLGYLDENSLIEHYSNFSSRVEEINEPINKIPIFNLNSFEKDSSSSQVFKDDSMSPFINENSLVLLDFDEVRILDNNVGLFKINEVYSIGRYYLDRNFIIVSYDNKNYSPIVIDKKSNFMVIGKYKGNILI